MLLTNLRKIRHVLFSTLLLSLCLIFGSSGTVSALSSGDLQSIVSNTSFYDPNCVGSQGASSTTGTGTTPLAAGGSVYVLGDSITERSQTVYQSTFQQKGYSTSIDASASRSLNGPGIDGNKLTGMQAIAQDATQIKAAGAIVVALGTNGGNSNQSVDAAITALRADNPKAPIYWVDTIVVDRPSYAPTIQASNQAIYSQASTEGYTVLPWFKTVDPNGNPQQLSGSETDTNGYIDNSDGLGVHPTPAGINALVNMVVSGVTASSSTTTTSATDGSNCACGPAAATTAGATNNVPIDGNNVKDSFEFFTTNGFTPTQAAGIVGNLMYESGGINPTEVEVGGGGGYGIAQFTPPTGLKTWAAANNQDYTTLTAQLDYILYQLNGSDSSVSAAIKQTTTVPDSTSVFLTTYERPLDPSQSINQRTADAQSAYSMYGAAGGATAVTASATSGGCSSGSSSPNCQSTTGDALILCTAKEYAGNYYKWGGGHDGYTNFRSACPVSSIASNAAKSTPADPGPCATDCSGLVSMSVDEAFNQSYDWTVAGAMVGAGANNWQAIPMNQVQAGDIVTTSEHVEIVDHYDAAKNTVYTFGSHETGTQTGPTSAGPGYYTGAYHWVGPGSTT